MAAYAVQLVWALAEELPPLPLSASERLRVERFVNDADRNLQRGSFVLRRLALGEIMRRRPENIEFGTHCAHCAQSTHGKPYVIKTPGDPAVSFSVSHAGDMTVVAASKNGEVGVDVEPATRNHECNELRAAFASDGDEESVSALDLWLAKEAALKLAATGLATPLQAVRIVSSSPRGATAAMPQGDAAISWVTLPHGYRAAVAAPSGPIDLRISHWQPSASQTLASTLEDFSHA